MSKSEIENDNTVQSNVAEAKSVKQSFQWRMQDFSDAQPCIDTTYIYSEANTKGNFFFVAAQCEH